MGIISSITSLGGAAYNTVTGGVSSAYNYVAPRVTATVSPVVSTVQRVTQPVTTTVQQRVVQPVQTRVVQPIQTSVIQPAVQTVQQRVIQPVQTRVIQPTQTVISSGINLAPKVVTLAPQVISTKITSGLNLNPNIINTLSPVKNTIVSAASISNPALFGMNLAPKIITMGAPALTSLKTSAFTALKSPTMRDYILPIASYTLDKNLPFSGQALRPMNVLNFDENYSTKGLRGDLLKMGIWNVRIQDMKPSELSMYADNVSAFGVNLPRPKTRDTIIIAPSVVDGKNIGVLGGAHFSEGAKGLWESGKMLVLSDRDVPMRIWHERMHSYKDDWVDAGGAEVPGIRGLAATGINQMALELQAFPRFYDWDAGYKPTGKMVKMPTAVGAPTAFYANGTRVDPLTIGKYNIDIWGGLKSFGGKAVSGVSNVTQDLLGLRTGRIKAGYSSLQEYSNSLNDTGKQISAKFTADATESSWLQNNITKLNAFGAGIQQNATRLNERISDFNALPPVGSQAELDARIAKANTFQADADLIGLQAGQYDAEGNRLNVWNQSMQGKFAENQAIAAAYQTETDSFNATAKQLNSQQAQVAATGMGGIGGWFGRQNEKASTWLKTTIGKPFGLSANEVDYAAGINKQFSEMYATRYPGMQSIGMAYGAGEVSGIIEKPVTAGAWAVAGLAMGGITRAVPSIAGLGPVSRGIAKISETGVGSKLVKYGPKAVTYGLAGLYGISSGLKVAAEPGAGRKLSKAGELTSTELIPMTVGGMVGYKLPEYGRAAYDITGKAGLRLIETKPFQTGANALGGSWERAFGRISPGKVTTQKITTKWGTPGTEMSRTPEVKLNWNRASSSWEASPNQAKSWRDVFRVDRAAWNKMQASKVTGTSRLFDTESRLIQEFEFELAAQKAPAKPPQKVVFLEDAKIKKTELYARRYNQGVQGVREINFDKATGFEVSPAGRSPSGVKEVKVTSETPFDIRGPAASRKVREISIPEDSGINYNARRPLRETFRLSSKGYTPRGGVGTILEEPKPRATYRFRADAELLSQNIKATSVPANPIRIEKPYTGPSALGGVGAGSFSALTKLSRTTAPTSSMDYQEMIGMDIGARGTSQEDYDRDYRRLQKYLSTPQTAKSQSFITTEKDDTRQTIPAYYLGAASKLTGSSRNIINTQFLGGQQGTGQAPDIFQTNFQIPFQQPRVDVTNIQMPDVFQTNIQTPIQQPKIDITNIQMPKYDYLPQQPQDIIQIEQPFIDIPPFEIPPLVIPPPALIVPPVNFPPLGLGGGGGGGGYGARGGFEFTETMPLGDFLSDVFGGSGMDFGGLGSGRFSGFGSGKVKMKKPRKVKAPGRKKKSK